MRKWSILAVMALLLTGLAATISAHGGAAQENTFPVTARFVNAMTNMDQINVYVNGSDQDQRVIENLDYGVVSEPIELTAPGAEIIIKAPVNLGFDQWLFDVVVPTAPGEEYLIVVSDFKLMPSQIDTSPLGDGNARARAMHAAAQAPNVDILINDAVAVTDLQYGRMSDAGELAAGTYTVTLNQAGTTNTALTQELTLEAGMIYSVIAIGQPGSTDHPLALLVVASTPAS